MGGTGDDVRAFVAAVLESGRKVKSFVCEGAALSEATEITHFRRMAGLSAVGVGGRSQSRAHNECHETSVEGLRRNVGIRRLL